MSADVNTMCNTFYEFNDFSKCNEAAGFVEIKAKCLRLKEIVRKIKPIRVEGIQLGPYSRPDRQDTYQK